MRRIGCVLFVLLYGLIAASGADAQETGERQDTSDVGFVLHQNEPNPFNPDTRIPFTLGESLFEDGRPVKVTIRIYNVLARYVNSPVALEHERGRVPVTDLEYTRPGDYAAFWDGRNQEGREVASGVYYAQLIVNGKSRIIGMLVSK